MFRRNQGLHITLSSSQNNSEGVLPPLFWGIVITVHVVGNFFLINTFEFVCNVGLGLTRKS